MGQDAQKKRADQIAAWCSRLHKAWMLPAAASHPPAQIQPQFGAVGLEGTQKLWLGISRGICTETHSRTHTVFCRVGIPNLHGLLFSAYNEDYGVIPASQGGAVGIERVKALRYTAARPL